MNNNSKLNGYYTIIDNKIVAWDDKKHNEKDHIKYFSDPNDAYTCGDPYTDYEKITGLVDALEEARNPLVAAFPQIGVELDGIIFSKNIETSSSDSIGKSKDKNSSSGNDTSNTDATSSSNNITVGVSVSAGFSLLKGPSADVSVSVSGSLSNETSNTYGIGSNQSNTTGSGEEKRITKSLSMKKSDAANLNANIRYINTGTASVYNLRPTLNFVLVSNNDKKKTISTIISKENNFTNSLLPNSKYPEISQSPMAFIASDDFNSQPITLNYDQVSLLENDGKLQLQITQINGLYAKYNVAKENFVSEYLDWNLFLPKIYNKTALISFTFKDNETLYRRVAANKFKSNERKIPQLTIKKAIEIGFKDVSCNDNTIVYKGREIDLSNFDIIFDQKTKDIVDEQYEKSQTIFANIILTQEMKIHFIEKKDKSLVSKAKDDKSFYSEAYNFFGYPGVSITNSSVDIAKLLEKNNRKNPFDVNYEINYTQFKDLNFLKEYLQKKFNDHMLKFGYKQKAIIEIENKTFENSSLIRMPDEEKYYIENFNNLNYQLSIKFSFTEFQQWFHISFKNITLNDNKQKSIYLNKLVNTDLNSNSNQPIVINLNSVISFETNLGEKLQILKEIIKSYLVVKLNANSALIDDLYIYFDQYGNLQNGKIENENISTNLTDAKFGTKSNEWYLLTCIKYFNEWKSQYFRIQFNNIVLKKPLPKYKNDQQPEVIIENWFKNYFINSSNQKEARLELAKLFFNNFE